MDAAIYVENLFNHGIECSGDLSHPAKLHGILTIIVECLIRILLFEDDKKIASFLNKGLKQEGYSVEHIIDGHTAIERALVKSFDVAIVDLMMPGMDGLMLIRSLRERGCALPLLVLSAKREVSDRVEGLQQGADDFLTKPFSFSELVARLKALVRRAENSAPMTELKVGGLKLDVLSRRVWREDELIELQPKEFDLLRYFMENAGRVITKTSLIEHVWNFNFDPKTNIVESRVCKLREKIDRNKGKTLLQTIRGVGYVFREDT